MAGLLAHFWHTARPLRERHYKKYFPEQS